MTDNTEPTMPMEAFVQGYDWKTQTLVTKAMCRNGEVLPPQYKSVPQHEFFPRMQGIMQGYGTFLNYDAAKEAALSCKGKGIGDPLPELEMLSAMQVGAVNYKIDAICTATGKPLRIFSDGPLRAEEADLLQLGRYAASKCPKVNATDKEPAR